MSRVYTVVLWCCHGSVVVCNLYCIHVWVTFIQSKLGAVFSSIYMLATDEDQVYGLSLSENAVEREWGEGREVTIVTVFEFLSGMAPKGGLIS